LIRTDNHLTLTVVLIAIVSFHVYIAKGGATLFLIVECLSF